MALRNPPEQSEFFAGSLKVQSGSFELRPPPLTSAQCGYLAEQLAREDCLAENAPAPEGDPALQFLALVSQAHATILRKLGFFLPEPIELAGHDPEKRLLRIAVPRIPMQEDLSARLFVRLANACSQSARTSQPIGPEIASLRSDIAKLDRPGPNVALFVRAAHELGMPLLQLHSNHLQVGHGARARVFNGSITDQTPSNGVAIARDKSLCSALLAQAGLPVANGALVRNLAEARKCAEAIGYPVVVKPANLDGGTAVSADVRTPQELEMAFGLARKASPKVLVESHIEGRDYRLLLFRGKLLTAIERTPGGVTGNGRDSVARLLETLNSSPDRGPGQDTIFYPVAFDEEARLMLRRQGLTPDSIPPKGAFVRLRRAANFALGGSVRAVDDEVHPDNLDLAARAARLLRLDLAGLDLILPDIARSWRETGGAICEINAQPFIGEPVRRNFHKLILEELVGDGGRIPLVLVVGSLDGKTTDALGEKLPGLAIAGAEGARRGGHPLTRPGASWLQACQAPLFDPDTEAALCLLDPASPVPQLSPADRFSAAYLLDTGQAGDGGIPPAIAALLRRSASPVAAPARYAAALAGAGLKHRQLDPERLEEELLAALSASG